MIFIKLIEAAILLISCNVVSGYRVGLNPYHRIETLDTHGKYQLEWLVDLEQKRVTFHVAVATRGYVGFGLSSYGKMAGSDIVIGGVKPDGTQYFSDRYAIGHGLPEIDFSQDWKLHLAEENKTHTLLTFSRDFDTCDPHDYLITEDKISLIWAYGDDDTIRYHHQHRGEYKVYLINPDYAPPLHHDPVTGETTVLDDNQSDIKVWTINTHVKLPPGDTTYWCTIHKAPSLRHKHHAIGVLYDVRLETPEAVRHSHHILVHKCNAPGGITPTSMFDRWTRYPGQDCLLVQNPQGPMPTELCSEFFQSWAIGGRIFFQPDNIGIPFGDSPTEYYMVQIHLDNPDRIPNVIVETKLDIFYTPNLRPIEAGLIFFNHVTPGLPPSLLVPPSSGSHKVYGFCGPECTRTMFPDEGITIYALLLHSHNSGRRMKFHHFRGNKELPWIVNDETFSFNYQQYRVLNEHVKIYPGDLLVAECIYDNTWANGTTVVGGFSSQQEMCSHAAFYHTRVRGHMFCGSEINSPEYRQRFLGVTNITWSNSRLEYVVDPPQELAGLTITEVSDNFVDWSLEERKNLQMFQLSHTQSSVCPLELFARPENERETENQFDSSNGYPVVYPHTANPYIPPNLSTCD